MKTAIYFDHESIHCRVCDALHGEGACQKRRGQHDVLVNLPGVVKFIAKHYGPVAVAKAYSDWTHFKNYVPDLNRGLVELVHTPYVSGTKNAADMRMLLDAYADTATATEVSTVVIVSCDRDFSHLAVCLRRLGKTVVGVGVDGARISREWVRACDKFHYYPIPKNAAPNAPPAASVPSRETIPSGRPTPEVVSGPPHLNGRPPRNGPNPGASGRPRPDDKSTPPGAANKRPVSHPVGLPPGFNPL